MLLFLSGILLVGCQFNETNEQSNLTPSHIVITSLRDNILIGERPAFLISIENNHDIPIEIPYPFQFHLITPNDTDISSQININKIADQEKILIIEPQSTTTLPLGIPSPVVDLLQLGQYTLWIELDDEAESSVRSNDAVFNIIENKYNVSPEDVALTIVSNSTYKADDARYIEIYFENLSNKPLTFLRAQDGSHMGVHYPMYLFKVTDQDGQSLSFPIGDVPSPPIYSEDKTFTIQPNHSYKLVEVLPRFYGLDHPGTYKIQLLYAVRDLEIFSPGKAYIAYRLEEPYQLESINWDEDVFLGHIMSNEITVIIEE